MSYLETMIFQELKNSSHNFGCPWNFFSFNYFQIGQHVAVLINNCRQAFVVFCKHLQWIFLWNSDKIMNTWDISGMFVVLWSITANIKTCEFARKPQSHLSSFLVVYFCSSLIVFFFLQYMFQKYFWCLFGDCGLSVKRSKH